MGVFGRPDEGAPRWRQRTRRLRRAHAVPVSDKGKGGRAGDYDKRRTMQADVFFFWILAPLLVVSAFAVIVAKNPVHSVLFLILSFVCAAGLFLLLGAEFLA